VPPSSRLSVWLITFLWVTTSPAADAQHRYSPEQLNEDLTALQQTIERTHPDLNHSTDPQQLAHAFDIVRVQLDRGMTRDEAWGRFAALNPVFADGHLFVGFPDWRSDSLAHLGTGFFPFEVYVDAEGRPFIRSRLGGAATSLIRARIDYINGMDARHVTRNLLAGVHGDTPAMRAELLSRRWWFYYWKLYGDSVDYDLRVTRGRTSRIRVPASRETPLFLADEASFDRQFRFEFLPGDAALLTLNSFSWHDDETYFEFTRRAFAQLREAGTRTLIIDVRANGGGDDSFWQRGILPYIATKPYTWGSSYRKRVVEKYRDQGERVGDVVSGTIAEWIQPEPDNPLRFSGRTYLLTGASTYSSAILFANVMQDFGFGTVAGTGGSARSRQSGGVDRYTLPHTGLTVWSPRFVLTRPCGASSPVMFEPDLELHDDPFRSRAAVDELLSRIRIDSSAAR
jgi:Peptidase family S41